MARTLVQTFDPSVLCTRRGKSLRGSKPLDGMMVVSKGQALALVTGTSTNHWQSITATSGSAGSAVFDFGGERFTLAYNSTAAQAQAAICALPNVGTGNCVVTAASSTLDAGALTFKFQGQLAGITQPPILLVSNGITGATPTINTAAQTCVPNGRLVAWNPAKVANPTAGPTVTAETGGTNAVGTYLAQMAWITALGETLPSCGVAVVVPDSTNDRIRFAAITSGNVPTGATGIKYYLNGILVATVALSSGAVPQTDVDAMPTTGQGTGPASVNTAFRATGGQHLFHSFATRAMASDNFGRVYDSTTPAWDNGSLGKPEADITVGGCFLHGDLVGITGYEQLLLDQTNGRLLDGVLGASSAEYYFGPEGS